MTTLLYFARLRQQVGVAQEDVELPSDVITVKDVIEWLKSRDEAFLFAFQDLRAIRAAVNQAHAPLDASVVGAREIAFFPPVTGG
jgi:molybdopterin synthase sulfur carrier subunit